MKDAATAPAPIVVTYESGVRFSARIRSHLVAVDQPVQSGGEDTAPSPLELLGASLGSCVAYYVQQFCQARGLPFEGMRVEVDQHGASHPHRIARFSVRVILPEDPPEQYIAILERVARSCPAHNTLVDRAEIDVAFEVAAVV